MRLTQLIEYLNANSRKDIRRWPYSHLNVTPSLKVLKSEYQRKLKKEKGNNGYNK